MKMERTRIPGVYARGSRYVAAYRDPDGIQRKKAFRTQGEAAAFKKQQEVAIHEGTYQAPSTITLHAYVDEWLPAYDQIRENTRDDYQTGVDTAKRFFNHREKLTQITPRRISEYVAWLTKQGLAPSSVRKRVAPLSSMFRTAMEQGLVRSNPCQGVRMPKLQAQVHDEDHEDTDVKVFTLEQLDTILRVVKHPPLFELLACTGLRISEALALEWRHLELNGSSPHVKVRRAIVRGQIGLPKSRYGKRDISLPFSIVRALRATEGASNELLFQSSADTALMPNNVRRRVLQPALEEAGCAWAGFHTFRHTYASMQLSRGTNIVALSRALGHHSASFTLQVYAHLMKGDEAPALEINKGETNEGLQARGLLGLRNGVAGSVGAGTTTR
jgi:site-specific recombinase XerD